MSPAIAAMVPTARADEVRMVQAAWPVLDRLHGPGELRAAVLSLLMSGHDEAEHDAWQLETRGVAGAADTRSLLVSLPAAAHPALTEAFSRRLASHPLEIRQETLAGARRLMCADQRVSPLDRLHLLQLRHLLHEPTPLHRGGLREWNELTSLPLALRQAIASLTAFMARCVPEPDAHATVGLAGTAWYQAVVTALWRDPRQAPACHVPDGDTLVRALRTLTALSWHHRPLLARTWTLPALAHHGRRLPLVAARSLRCACVLLDTPLPPDLGPAFIELPDDGPRDDTA
ncbi:hypothetical protein [Sphaerotilus hippei]|nr:hypothetical protein [Sphaerotilus hippei]